MSCGLSNLAHRKQAVPQLICYVLPQVLQKLGLFVVGGWRGSLCIHMFLALAGSFSSSSLQKKSNCVEILLHEAVLLLLLWVSCEVRWHLLSLFLCKAAQEKRQWQVGGKYPVLSLRVAGEVGDAGRGEKKRGFPANSNLSLLDLSEATVCFPPSAQQHLGWLEKESFAQEE